MTTDDWLVGRDRHSEAAERIYAAAAELMSRQGYDAFSIDTLAATVHCSPATIYRHAGGKAAIRDAVLGRQAERILDSVREAIAGLTGPERIVTGVAGGGAVDVADLVRTDRSADRHARRLGVCRRRTGRGRASGQHHRGQCGDHHGRRSHWQVPFSGRAWGL